MCWPETLCQAQRALKTTPPLALASASPVAAFRAPSLRPSLSPRAAAREGSLWQQSALEEPLGPSDRRGGQRAVRRIHFGDTQGRVLGQAVKQEPGDVEERLRKVEAERLLLPRGKHTEPHFSAEPLLGRVRGWRRELRATSAEERSPRGHLPCARGSLRPHLHDPQPKPVREAPSPSLQ